MSRNILGENQPELDPSEDATGRINDILEAISPENFKKWYDEWQYAKNIREGQAFFNKPGYVKPPERHSPSSLLQCQRKVFYMNQNAPEERPNPEGIFWTGEKFEEEIAMPFLEDLAEEVHPKNYVQNSMWVDYTLDTHAGEIRIKGETDPVICDSQANPLVVTEVKNKKSLDKFDRDDPEPDKHHKAQAHAYMYGLSKSFDRDIHKAVIIYGDRTQFNLLPIPIEFDLDFWENQVVRWAANHSQYRLDENLPPGEPAFSWECKFCDYSQRCGKGADPDWYNGQDDMYADDADWRDVGIDGFLPLVEYPKSKVVEYLRAHAPKGAKLTPTLANQHPGLTDKFEIHDWYCPECESRFPFDQFEWDGDRFNSPWCPDCQQASLRAPDPSDQHD